MSQVQREADDKDGTVRLSELCWDGKRRVTVKVHPKSGVNPEGGVSFLQRWCSIEALGTGVRLAEPGAPQWECDYL